MKNITEKDRKIIIALIVVILIIVVVTCCPGSIAIWKAFWIIKTQFKL